MVKTDTTLGHIEQLFDDRLTQKLETASNLNRKVVSFQANKLEPVYRWFKYKEGFSSSLVKYFLSEYSPKAGRLLDPFAGSGTALFAGKELGWDVHGIELLPVGGFVIQTREAISVTDINLLKVSMDGFWSYLDHAKDDLRFIKHISITKDAFDESTEASLNKYLSYCSTITEESIKIFLLFCGLSILEEISYTRKDGQYLRWDSRSKRKLSGKPFDKGRILTFREALTKKFNEILQDLSSKKVLDIFQDSDPSLKDNSTRKLNITIGSCLEELPKIESGFFDCILTSPPYCNRYDYTRTYALELVYLGIDDVGVKNLRQAMLSCTVENKEKIELLNDLYNKIGRRERFDKILSVYNKSLGMSKVNSLLAGLNSIGKLNNNNIPRMIKNYFLELCFVIAEMSRITKKGGYCIMVNDNVRYGGEEIPVDLILSDFAISFGYDVRKILVLPQGKGNSSQQMGSFGRIEVRKCVYVWQKQ